AYAEQRTARSCRKPGLYGRFGSIFWKADFTANVGIAVRFHLMKTGKKLVHLSNDLSFVGEVHIVVRIRDQDDTGARHSAPEGICPGRTACSVVAIKAALRSGSLAGKRSQLCGQAYIASA